MLTADVVGLYPSIPHDAGQEALRKVLDNQENKKISIDDLTKMTEFFLKNNCFQFNGKIKKQILETAIVVGNGPIQDTSQRSQGKFFRSVLYTRFL